MLQEVLNLAYDTRREASSHNTQQTSIGYDSPSRMQSIGSNSRYGIEAEQKAVKLSVTNKIKWGYFDMNYQSKEKFDLICLTQMITYVRDNYELLIHVKKLLNKDGIVFITTQNPESRFVRENLKMDANKHVANMIFSKKKL